MSAATISKGIREAVVGTLLCNLASDKTITNLDDKKGYYRIGDHHQYNVYANDAVVGPNEKSMQRILNFYQIMQKTQF